MAFDILTINGEKYELRCNYSFEEKINNENAPAIKLGLYILRLRDKHVISWQEFRESYLSEKIADFIKNTINGQRTFYWK
jgi:hypothetical protein